VSVSSPTPKKYFIIYRVSYANLQSRINQTVFRGILLMIFGVGVGVFFAYFFAMGIVRPIKKLTEGAKVIAKGDFKYRVRVKSKDEIFVLANAFNSMAQDLEISTKALVYKERVAKELELANKIQKELLPQKIPAVAGRPKRESPDYL